MAKIKSTAVKIFPSAFRGPSSGPTKYNPESRLNTEFNVTNLINRLASKNSFVISWNPSSKIVIFNINGYYFESNLTEFLGVGGAGVAWTNIYASIKLLPFQTTDSGNTSYKAFTLVGTEDTGSTVPPTGRILDVDSSGTFVFQGLDLHQTPITPADGIYELHLLSGGPSSWVVPVTSVLKFKATDVEGLPTINNSITADTTSTIFAAATAGTAGQLSVSQGGVLAPTWISTADVVVGEASQAVQLKTSRNLWGRPFNGTAAISGAITGTGNITPTTNNASNIGASDNVYANVYATTFTGNLTGSVTGTASGNLTSASTLDASKLSGTIPAAVAQAEWDAAYTHISATNNPHSVTKEQVGLGNAENTTDANKPVSTATQTALDLKANINSPTFTGTVGGITATMVGLGNVTNESKATMFASPTFTGTVSGVTASMVGLGSVNNTSDANKPVSTATQTALNLKANLAGPTFTGTVGGITASMVGLGNVTNESKATMFTNAALTGNPTAPTQSSTNNSTRIATTAFVKTATIPVRESLGTIFSTATNAKNDTGAVFNLSSAGISKNWTEYKYLLLEAVSGSSSPNLRYGTALIPVAEILSLLGIGGLTKTYTLMASRDTYQTIFAVLMVEVRFTSGDETSVRVWFSYSNSSEDKFSITGIN